MTVLQVDSLEKRYPKFHLHDVSFSLDEGYIMGFIGINGAGKTTTLKSILNMVRPDSGEVTVLGRPLPEHEVELKEHLGVVLGDKDVYRHARVDRLTRVVRRFYQNWDDAAYEHYCRRFSLDQDKRVGELSTGMKTKYLLALALSHHARLLILDEPTSGLDPAARDDLLEVFQEVVEDGRHSILYSTHITSDLEKCADYITYIHDGRVLGSATKDDFVASYRLVQGPNDRLTDQLKGNLIAHRSHAFGFVGLARTELAREFTGLELEVPTLDDVMVYHARKEADHA